MSNFNPGYTHQQFLSNLDNRTRYEGLKASFRSDLLAAERCMSKCNVSFDSNKLGDREQDCLRQCYAKYFDSELLIEDEYTNYVRGLPM